MATAVPNAREEKILLNKLKFNTLTDERLLERWLNRPARQTYFSSRAKSLPTCGANTTPKHSESPVIADTRCVSRLVSRLHGQAQRDGSRSRHRTPQPTSTELLTAKDNGVKLTDLRTLRLHFAPLTIESRFREEVYCDVGNNYEDHRGYRGTLKPASSPRSLI